MIKTLKLYKFRKHVEETFDFGKGLVALRGPNESGKSTIIEACLYALYGARALRDSLSECVTWGHKEGDLKVMLVIELESKDYTYIRSKAGAEVYVSDGPGAKSLFVTGQSEVTAFSAQLLGADAKTASSLMLADQSGLRGTLNEGPSAVSGLMGKLADFDLIDRIILGMQETLLLGADGPIREKLKGAEAERDEATASIPSLQVLAGAELSVLAAEESSNALREQRQNVELPAFNAASDRLREAERKKTTYDDAVTAIDKAQKKLGEAITDLDDAKGRVVAVDHDRIAALRKDVFDAVTVSVKVDAWEAFNRLPLPPDKDWEGDTESFFSAFNAAKLGVEVFERDLRQLEEKIKERKRDLVTEGVCKSCGTDLSKRTDIVARNTAAEADIATLEESLPAARENLSSAKVLVTNFEAIDRADRLIRSKVTSLLAPYVTLDETVVPPKVEWSGGSDLARPDLGKVKAELSALEQAAENSKKAEGEVEALTKALAQARMEYDCATSSVVGLKDVDLTAYKEAQRAASDALNAIDNAIFEKGREFNEMKSDFDALKVARDIATARANAANLRVDEYLLDIERMGFNNSLLKKMRAIKPSVTDRLWNSILSAVSQFFTQMRGEASVVTKDSVGFKVNGASVKSLSGSTLDVLAVAVRVALTKTFIPNTTMLVLDEPGAGCDKSRMASLLGFLSSVGFKQVILASHDELSEAVSDNVITIGD